jgi:superfamily II DNA or RNA helicase
MITLRPDQQAAVDVIVGVRRGIIKAPAGAGKTIIAAAALDRYVGHRRHAPRVLWLGHTTEQCAQGVVACEEFGLVPGPFKVGKCKIDFKCYQAEVTGFGYDVVICDECHHIAAPEFRKIVEGFVGGTIWGFSATPERQDDLADDVYALVGPIVHTVERAGLVETGKLLAAQVYFHAPNRRGEFDEAIEADAEKGFQKMKYSLGSVAAQISKQPIEAVARRVGAWKEISAIAARKGIDTDAPMFRLPHDDNYRGMLRVAATIELKSRARWHACQTRGIFENDRRNIKIFSLMVEHQKESVLVLVGSIEHGKLLQKAMTNGGLNSVVVYSKMGAKKRRQAIADFRSGALKCAIATSLADEGLDVPRANVLILACAGRSEGKVEQRSGRVLRAFADQTHGVVHDFWDHQHPLLMNQSRARARVYAEMKYEFVGGDAAVMALKAIGVKRHPLLNNLPVPVLAEPNSEIGSGVTATGNGEVRESTDNEPGKLIPDSRDGQNFQPQRRLEPRSGTRNNGMIFINGAWRIDHKKINKKTGCGVASTQVDSVTSDRLTK